MTDAFAPVPYPRVLARGLSDDELDLIRPLVGTLDVLEDEATFHPEEYDAMIVVGGEFHSYAGLIDRRVVFAEPPFLAHVVTGRIRVRSDEATSAQTQIHPARRLRLPDIVRETGLAGLITASCTPGPKELYRGLHLPVFPLREVTSFLEEDLDEPLVLAALLTHDGSTRHTGSDSVLWLPDMARTHLVQWLQTAFRLWRVGDPERFPETADWLNADEWAAESERAARAALDAFEDAEKVRREAAAMERAAMSRAIDLAAPDGEAWRTLLTGTGDPLVAAVAGVLEGFGFTVIDADALEQHKGKKREDLRVMDGSWVAVAEVKGSTGAAKSNALLQVANAAMQYGIAEGKPANALWYVVNAYRGDDPAQRAVVLAGRDDDITAFADEYHGLIIDTRELFALRRAVVRGTLQPSDARALLKTSTGRFAFTDDATTPR